MGPLQSGYIFQQRRTLCNWCLPAAFRQLRQHPGGAQAEVAKATRVSMMSARRYPKVSPKRSILRILHMCIQTMYIYIYIVDMYTLMIPCNGLSTTNVTVIYLRQLGLK